MYDPTPGQPVQVRVKGGGSNPVVVVLLVLILAAIVGGGIFFYLNQNQGSPLPGVGPTGPVGTWDFITSGSGGGAGECKLVLQQSGNQLTGTCTTGGGIGVSFSGSVSGQNIQLVNKSTVQFPTGGQYVCTTDFDGSMTDANHMGGTVTEEADCHGSKDQVGTWSATRVS